MRQALFDMLRHAPWAAHDLLQNAVVLDVFAGSGALGLEALSRGAAHVSFIENNRIAAATLIANIKACQADDRATLHRADALKPPPGAPHDLILLDPPYGQNLIPPSLAALAAQGWIAPDAVIAGEFSRNEALPAGIKPLAERAHGAARLIIWQPLRAGLSPVS